MIVAAFGCGPSPTEQTIAKVKLTVLASDYARTDTIKANLQNGLGAGVAYDANECPGFLIERQVNNGWQTTDSTPPRGCTVDQILLAIPPGADQLVILQPIHDWMPNGEYRLQMTVQPNGGQAVRITSNTFRIEAPD